MTESETVELKKSLAELKQGIVSLAAMLNKHGEAELWFGIAPNGKAVGLDQNDKTLRDVSQAIAASIDPRIYPEITREEVNGKSCLRVRARGQDRPYYAHGRPYMRVADEDRQMSARELETLILRQNRAALRWDNDPIDQPLSMLNEARIRQFVQTAGLAWDNTTNTLDKLGLLRDGRPVNAARLFFADEPIELRCAVFATQTSATILDRHDFHGTLLELIEEAQKFILKNIHIGMRLDGMRRVDVPEIAVPALREAIINAFCHRDWRDPDYVQVAVYRDRVEICNPGELYENLTLEELRRGGVSRRRNPLIADLLRRIHLVEAWGRGVPLILANAPDVTFREVAGLFIASFARPSGRHTLAPNAPSPDAVEHSSAGMKDAVQITSQAVETALETPEIAPKTPEISPETPEIAPKPSGIAPKNLETAPKTPESVPVPSSPASRRERTEHTLLQLLQEQPGLTADKLAKLSGMSLRGVKYNLDRLKQTGRLKRHGPAKGGYWEVTDGTGQLIAPDT